MVCKVLMSGEVELRVYATKRGMQRGLHNFTGQNHSNTNSCVCPFKLIKIKTGEKSNRVFLFTHKKVDLPTLIHESLHVATSLARFHKKRVKLSQYGINLTEERLAYYQTWVIQEILKVIHPKRNSDYYFNVYNIEDWAKTSFKKS